MGRAARADAEERFGRDRIVARYEGLYLRVLEGGAGPGPDGRAVDEPGVVSRAR
jgi:hypothetical protein